MTICIIPARKGSKRIKNKNIIKLNNIPLIGHVIKQHLSLKFFLRLLYLLTVKKFNLLQKNMEQMFLL